MGATLPTRGKRIDSLILVQLLPLGMIVTGVHWRDLVLCVFLYYLRMFFISAAFHRYFSHRSYKMGRVMQFLMCLGGTTALQSGMMLWVSSHRRHHKYSDTERDPHSSRLGMWWSHMGWLLTGVQNKRSKKVIKEFSVYPELMFLERYSYLTCALIVAPVLWLFGWSGVFAGFFLSTTLLFHGTFSINSLNHKYGTRRYDTGDMSTNNWFLAIVSMGEGWHNNHHHYQSSTAQGFFKGEFDPSYRILKVLEKFGLVWDVSRPPPQALVRDLLNAPRIPETPESKAS